MRRDFWVGFLVGLFAVMMSSTTVSYITDLATPDFLIDAPVYMGRFLSAVLIYTVLTVGIGRLVDRLRGPQHSKKD